MKHRRQDALQWTDIGRIPDLPTGIYRRRSREDQSSYSPAAQERIGRAACESHQLLVVESYLDDDYSGTNGQRPAFEQMLEDARAGRIKVVLVPKMDRFARDVILCLQTYDLLRSLGVLIYSVAEPLDFDTPMGRKFLIEAASSAEWYSRNLATEVAKGLREKAEQGGWVGLLPLGYESRFDRDARGERIKGSGRAVMNADIATVRAIFALYATNVHSDLSIAEALNQQGLTVSCKGMRGPFQRDTVKGILTNPFYIGIVRYRGVEYPGLHEAAIDRVLWERCQDIRARRRRQGGGRLATRGQGGLLSELSYCGWCGARLHSWQSGNASCRTHRYYCSTRRRYGTSACAAPMLHGTAVEEQVLDLLRSLVLPERIVDRVIAEVEERLARPAQTAPDTARLAEQLRRLSVAYRSNDPTIDDQFYHRERARLEAQLATGAPSRIGRVLEIEQAAQLLSDMGQLLDAASQEQRRILVQRVIRSVWLANGEITAWTPEPVYAVLVDAVVLEVERVTSTGLEPATFSSGG